MIPVGLLDTETTGVDVENDRIVTAFAGRLDAGGILLPDSETWLIDPLIPIPAGATAIHGITTEYARENGSHPEGAIAEIVNRIETYLGYGIPLVAFNASYDLTILNHEIDRNGLRTPADGDFGSNFWFPLEPIIDPHVLDKAMDPYRKGKRTLQATYLHYLGDPGPEWSWHGAQADAIAAGRLAQHLLQDDRLAGATLQEIHQWQIVWRRRQQESLADYFRTQGGIYGDVKTGWPLQ